jgi:hypothetical protein
MKTKTGIKTKRVYYKQNEYTIAGDYTIDIKTDGIYKLTVIGGGGGSGQVDGGVDAYGDTARTNHYGHDGGCGGIFVGYALLTKGTLSITVGNVGLNRAGKDVATGHGGDSYVVFTPEGGEPIEIIRACGGHSGFHETTFTYEVDGGVVTFNPDYIVKVLQANKGRNGRYNWVVHL